MSDPEAIEQAVASLPPKELAEFSAWFETYAAERFDEAIERDARNGALRQLAEEATRQFRGGIAKEL